jgi:hypothetical protein
VNLTRWEIYYAVYLATLDSGDAICANWRGTLALPMCGSGRGAAIRLCLTGALSRSGVLLVNSAWRFQFECLFFNDLRPSLPSRIGLKIAYTW